MPAPKEFLFVAVAAVAIGLCACSKEEAEEAAGDVKEAAEQVGEEAAEAVETSLSPEERAAKIGFAAHLPKDSDWVMSIQDGRGMVEALRALELWQMLEQLAEEESGASLAESIGEPQLAMVDAWLGDEFFLAYGPGAATQARGLLELQARVNYYQFRSLAEAFAESVVAGDFDSLEEANSDPSSWLMEMAADIDELLPLLEDFEVPPLLAGVRVVDEEMRAQAQQQLSSMLAFMGEAGEAVTIEQAGATLEGLRFEGAMLADQIDEDTTEIDDMIGAENRERLVEILREKSLVLAVGAREDVVLLYLGADEGSCPIVEDIGESLAASDDFEFIDEYEELPVHGLLYGSEALFEASMVPGFKDMAEGIRDGLARVNAFPESRELSALLGMVGEHEQALLDLYESDSFGGVITIDQGARFEIHGGGDQQYYDDEAEHQLAGLGEGEQVLFFADWVVGAEYERRSGEFLGTLVEATYALAGSVAKLPSENEDLAMFAGQYRMFDEVFREDLLGVWDGLRQLDDGLGAEGAVVVDLAASVPPIPGVPQELVEGGRFVRASYVSPVVDREKIGQSWTRLDGSVRGLLKSVKEAGLAEINMLTPTSSEKNELVTWYFDALAFSDDLKPSVTLNDEWFIASSSRTQALDLVAAADGGAEGPERRGGWAELKLDVLREYVDETLQLVADNADAVIPGEGDREEFLDALPKVKRLIEASEEFERITLHDRMEGDTHRITLHFKTR